MGNPGHGHPHGGHPVSSGMRPPPPAYNPAIYRPVMPVSPQMLGTHGPSPGLPRSPLPPSTTVSSVNVTVNAPSRTPRAISQPVIVNNPPPVIVNNIARPIPPSATYSSFNVKLDLGNDLPRVPSQSVIVQNNMAPAPVVVQNSTAVPPVVVQNNGSVAAPATGNVYQNQTFSGIPAGASTVTVTSAVPVPRAQGATLIVESHYEWPTFF